MLSFNLSYVTLCFMVSYYTILEYGPILSSSEAAIWAGFIVIHYLCQHPLRHRIQDSRKRSSPDLPAYSLNARDPSFDQLPRIWTILRDPARRCVSQFNHFNVARRGENYSDLRLLEFMNSSCPCLEIEYTAMHEKALGMCQKRQSPLADISQHILRHYDFIGILERRWESLALMKILWGLQTSDMIVLDSKRSGGYDDGKYEGKCFKIPVAQVMSSAVRTYLGNDFRRWNHDYALYALANRSLDWTIDAVGRELVNLETLKLRAAQAYAEAMCQDKAIFPCSPNGTAQAELAKANCYYGDNGCGYPCIQELFDRTSTVPAEYFRAVVADSKKGTESMKPLKCTSPLNVERPSRSASLWHVSPSSFPYCM